MVVTGGGAVVGAVVGSTGAVTCCAVVVFAVVVTPVVVVVDRSSSRARRVEWGNVLDRVLAALEVLPDRIGLRQREVLGRRVAGRPLHEQPPDLRREAAAGDGDPVHVLHRDLALRVADPDRRLELRHVAAEPRVGVVVGRAGLAGRGTAEVGAHAGAAEHVLLEDLRHRVGDPVRDHALPLWLAPAGVGVDLAVGEHDLPDRHRLRVDPAGCDRRACAQAMSSGDNIARAEPDRGNELERRLWRTPASRAISATFSGPTSSVSCA